MIGILLAGALAGGEPPPGAPANPCTPPQSCRYVGDFALRGKAGDIPVHAGAWMPFMADGRLTLYAGESVVVRLQDDGAGGSTAVLVSAGRSAGLDRQSDALLDHALSNQESGAETFSTEPVGKALDVPAGEVRITFDQPPGDSDMVLKLENASGEVIDYAAEIVAPPAEPQPTSVCPLRKVGLETWPFPFPAIRLSGFRIVRGEAGPATIAECD